MKSNNLHQSLQSRNSMQDEYFQYLSTKEKAAIIKAQRAEIVEQKRQKWIKQQQDNSQFYNCKLFDWFISRSIPGWRTGLHHRSKVSSPQN
jgi:hypothetical protein